MQPPTVPKTTFDFQDQQAAKARETFDLQRDWGAKVPLAPRQPDSKPQTALNFADEKTDSGVKEVKPFSTGIGADDAKGFKGLSDAIQQAQKELLATENTTAGVAAALDMARASAAGFENLADKDTSAAYANLHKVLVQIDHDYAVGGASAQAAHQAIDNALKQTTNLLKAQDDAVKANVATIAAAPSCRPARFATWRSRTVACRDLCSAGCARGCKEPSRANGSPGLCSRFPARLPASSCRQSRAQSTRCKARWAGSAA